MKAGDDPPVEAAVAHDPQQKMSKHLVPGSDQEVKLTHSGVFGEEPIPVTDTAPERVQPVQTRG